MTDFDESNPEDPQDLPPDQDLSLTDADNPATHYAMTSDEAAVKDMQKRTSTAGKLATVGMLILAGAFGFMYFQGEKQEAANRAGLEEIDQLEDPSQVPVRLRAMLPEAGSPDIKSKIMLNLGALKDAESVPLLIKELPNKGIVRRDAARALAMIGSPAADNAKAALLAELPKTNEIDRSNVVWALAVLKETSASDAILEEFVAGRLQDKDGFSPKVIMDAVGIARLSSEELRTHEEEPVRVLTAHALAEAASPEVVEPMGKLLEAELAREAEKQSTEVIRAAAAGLGRTGDARAAGPLFSLLKAKPGMRPNVFDALSKSTSAKDLLPLLDAANDERTRLDMVKLLADTRDPKAAEALAKHLSSDNADIRHAAASGLADLGDKRAGEPLLEFAAGDDNNKADAALVALRTVAGPGMTSKLLEITKNHPYRNSAVLRALGATGDKAAEATLLAALEGDDMGAAAIALADLNSDAAFKKLKAKLPRPPKTDMSEPSVTNEMLMLNRKAAIEGVGRFGRPEVAKELMKIVEDPMDDRRLRSLAAASLGSVATPEDMAAVIARVKDPAAEEDTKRYLMQAIWQKPRPELDSELLSLLGTSGSAPVRRSAAIALGYGGNPANDAKLVELLEAPLSRREAAVAIAMAGGEAAVTRLMELLAEDRDLEEVLRLTMTADGDTFNVLTKGMFESGQVWRRARAAEQLNLGADGRNYGYAWTKLVDVLRAGWDGTNGVGKRDVRDHLWNALTGDDAERRRFAAELLIAMPERGLLLRARDAGGNGAAEARKVLLPPSVKPATP